jgi:uncharacterized protein
MSKLQATFIEKGQKLINRDVFLEKIDFQYKIHSVCGILGPRQVGKTTLAKQYATKYKNVEFYDLENPTDLAMLENPILTLQNSKADLIVIDEVQFKPELFKVLRVLVDERPRKFLILGSASRDLIQQSSETLAGRIGYIELPPFSINEVENIDKLWIRGGYPKSFLANNTDESFAWRQSYISTFLERDIPNLGFSVPPLQMRRLWMMAAHNHGNKLNISEISKSIGLTNHSVKKYIDILAGTFMIRLLQPWYENIKKRQVKLPKIYVRDSGILHSLFNLKNKDALFEYPKLGASWEGFALEEIIKFYNAQVDECFFWGTQDGAELDLLIIKNGKRFGFEFKYSDAPKITKSMKISLENLKLDHLFVVYPHNKKFAMYKKITAIGLDNLTQL